MVMNVFLQTNIEKFTDSSANLRLFKKVACVKN